MGSEGPKLYTHKPKKGQLKRPLQQLQPSSSMASSTPPGTAAHPPPPPSPPKESFIRRNKFVWPILLAVNFTVGAYLFMRTKGKDGVKEEEVPNVPSAPVSTTSAIATVTEKPVSPSIVQPPKPLEPIPENQQLELFKWILEEKRKLKPKDPAERKRIDEEKALLKQFIRTKSIPSL